MGRIRNQMWVEALEPRQLLAVDQVGGIGYLPSDNGTRLQRYDVAAEQWLAPVTLVNSPGGATASLVDGEGIYVAYGRIVMRYNLDGSAPTHLINAPDNVHDIHSDGRLLFLNHTAGLYARFISIDKNTNAIIDSVENYVDSVYGSSISTTTNRIFGRTQGISPADISYMAYDDAGNFTFGGGSPYHGDYPSASTTWVFPLGNKVVDSSGGVYAASDLTRLHSFGTLIDDITFVGNDVPVVLRGNTLTAYSSAILPAGSKTLARAATQVATNGTNVIAFNPDASNANRYDTQIVALSDLKAPAPGQPVNPVGLAYTPDDIEVAADGHLLILDIQTQSVFRWESDVQRYGQTIPLIDVPKFMAYSGETETLYVAYASGLINQLDLSEAVPTEAPFATLATAPLGLSTAGKYVFAVDGSGAWVSHYSFAPDGTQISWVDWNYYSTEYIWSAENSRMYFFRDDTSPNDLLSEPIGADGKIGRYMDSPLHTSSGFTHPIRVSPDGSIVILGSGLVHNAHTLARNVAGLGNTVSDIAWLNGTVYTVRSISGNAQFQQWTGSTFAPGAVAQLAGIPLRLLSIDDAKLVGIYQTTAGGVPQFRVMDSNFQPIAAPSPAWLAPGSAATWNASTKVLTVTGAATITFDPGADAPLITASGPTAVLTIDPSGATPRVDVGGLTLSDGARATLSDAATQRVLVVHGGGLNVGAGTLDLGDNDLILHYSSAVSPAGTWNGSGYDGITGMIQSGRTVNGTWDGPGIITSMPDAASGLTGIGVGEAANLLGLGAGQTAVWDGHTIDASTVIVKYTFAGDANLDGQIDAGDYGIIDNFVQVAGASGYANGDFNYDGFIDAGDYGIIDNNVQAQGSPLGASVAAAAAAVEDSTSAMLPSPDGRSSPAAIESVKRGNPFGSESWMVTTAARLGFAHPASPRPPEDDRATAPFV